VNGTLERTNIPEFQRRGGGREREREREQLEVYRMATQDEIREGKKQVLLSKLRLYADENGKIDKEIVLECIIEVCGVSKDTKKAWWAALHAWGFLTTTIKGKNSITRVTPAVLEENHAPPVATQEVRA
jgi:hypothetical protein